MPAKKGKGKKKGRKPLKVKHLTNALFWNIQALERIRAALLAMDPDTEVSTSAAASDAVTKDGSNTPRVFNCPPR